MDDVCVILVELVFPAIYIHCSAHPSSVRADASLWWRDELSLRRTVVTHYEQE